MTVKELEKAGAFEGLRLADVNEEMTKVPLWENGRSIRTIISGLLLVIGLTLLLVGVESNLSIFLFASSIVIGGFTLFIQGIKKLFQLRFDMKTLMTIAIIGAVAIGEWAEGAAVVFFFAISEWLETYSMDKARQSIRSLMGVAPKEATVRREGEEILVPVDEIVIGDVLIVKPGEKIAMDGHVIKGFSSVNQAAITGESIPVQKVTDDEVFAGTLNEEGLLEIRVTKKSEDTTIAKIIHMVEEAQSERAPAQAFIDRFAKYYTPAVMVFALLIVTVPPLFFGGPWDEWIYRGLALLVVACPCALVISTPVAIVTAIGNAARNGVLIKGGVYLEEAGALTAIAFDKTGTLTKGVPVVTDIMSIEKNNLISDEKNEAEWLQIAAAIECGSQHPLAKAVTRKAKQAKSKNTRYEIDEFQSLTGKGVRASIEGVTYYVGSPKLFEQVLPNDISSIYDGIYKLQGEGKTVIIVGTDRKLLGVLAIRDEIRPESQQVIKGLNDLGIKSTVMLTGDNTLTANAIGKELGISEVKAELLPKDKLEAIKGLKKDGKVAMIGDGVNDAPALAASTVGVAMGGAGTDTALETADIALMADDISKLPFTIRLSRKALEVIRQNIAFSLAIKLIALGFIILGWLPLWLAIIADVGATLLVTLNAMRLTKVKQ